jgi:hypothetical protein
MLLPIKSIITNTKTYDIEECKKNDLLININIINDYENDSDFISVSSIDSHYSISNRISSINNINNSIYIKTIVILLIYIFYLPIPFCDLYFGFMDNTCVSLPINNFPINLKYYLIIIGWFNIYIIILISFFICYINDEIKKLLYLILGFRILFYISLFIGLIINILGGIIFWIYIDNTKCSNTLYYYIFITLIIKLLIIIIIFLKNKYN